jgi:sulfatase modifying factor 1
VSRSGRGRAARVVGLCGVLALAAPGCLIVAPLGGVRHDVADAAGDAEGDVEVDGDADGSGAASPDRDSVAGDTGMPTEHRSCLGLPKTCGPNQDADCCASNEVPGVTTASFLRSFDGMSYTDNTNKALVSDFRLDTYEITVGRFRKFVAAYAQDMIAQGAGANPNNPSDPGWSTAWNAILPVSSTVLTTSIQCDATFQTWTAGQDSLPMNCLNWYEAEAFCIWDGGRLPTEAEWNYAAAGGTDQHVYPWGNTAPDANASLAVYGCFHGGTGTCTGVSNLARVGAISAGNGRYGQADLAGNVWEWVQDRFAAQYAIVPCNNCSDLTGSAERVFRGGGFRYDEPFLRASSRVDGVSADHSSNLGARCARN